MDTLQQHAIELEQALISLNQNNAEAIIKEALSANPAIDATGLLISHTLTNIGEAWGKGNVSLSQVYMSGLICERIIEKVLPASSFKFDTQPTMAIGVFEDYHLLGARIIFSTLRASGFNLINLGGGLTINALIDIINDQKIEILLLSVLMLPSALRIKKLIEKLNNHHVKIVVGGAPFRLDQELWKETGAYAFGNDSADALKIVTDLTKRS